MMKNLQCNLPDALYRSLSERAGREEVSLEHLVVSILAEESNTPFHTLFQVSTSSALVEGLYQGAVRVGQLLSHGDFGLGTFVNLDGEMVVLDGTCFQVRADGAVTQVEESRLIPYAVVTRFQADKADAISALRRLSALKKRCDSLRDSNNLFHAFRIDGKFSSIRVRVMRPVTAGTGLTSAADEQAESVLADQQGTLVGLWSPGFAGAFSVPGYHFHFLSSDRTHGGHLLDCSVAEARIEVCVMHDMHVSLPETAEFLRADLSRDPSKALRDAEQ